MNRIEWNAETAVQPKPREHYIKVQPKNGLIILSNDLTADLGIAKHRLVFVQDKDRPSDWYLELYPATAAKAFTLRMRESPKRKALSAVIQNVAVARAIITSLNLEGGQRFMVSPQAEKGGLYPIITKSAKRLMKPRK